MRRVAVASLAILLGGSLAWIALVQRSVRRTLSEAASAGRLGFILEGISNREAIGFESLAPAAGYTVGAMFHGKLYLAGAGGLSEFSSLDANPRRFRPGLELPPAKVVALATGTI